MRDPIEGGQRNPYSATPTIIAKMTEMNAPSNMPKRGDPIAAKYFRLIAEDAVDWEEWISPAGKLLWVNKAVERWTGYTPDECLRMEDYPLPLIVPEDRQRMAAHYLDAVSGSVQHNVEFQVLHRDGSRPHMAVSWRPMVDDDGQFLGARVSARDITEKMKLREQLRLQNEHLEQLVQERTAKITQLEKHRLQMQKLAALGELSAGVAHEINNPLAGIRNAFALLKRSLPPDVRHYEKLDLIDKEIERISGITHQMYQLYRPSQQQASEFSIYQIVDETIALTLPMAKKQQVVVQTDFHGVTHTQIESREGELKQILLNLVHNAIQASSKGQEILIEVATTDSNLTIRVRDHGSGIEEGIADKIFDPFFSTKTATVGEGMGLGLSVTRGLVESMNGTVSVHVDQKQGTLFVVELPRRLSGQVPPNKTSKAGPV
jgi:PAS domain S-box-containing protein